MIRSFIVSVAFLLAVPVILRADAPSLARSVVIEDNVLYLRVKNVTGRSAAEIRAAQRTLTTTNGIIGNVLDLRFAGGAEDEPGAAKDFFPTVQSPLVILVNAQTSGAAAVLASQLRANGRGMVMGPANEAGMVQPDIAVSVNPADEKRFEENPYALVSSTNALALSATNDLLPFIDHTSEAELVQKRVKDGEEEAAPSARVEPVRPVIRDPVLARAVDLLKALAILKTTRG